jgi:uncharacterized protein
MNRRDACWGLGLSPWLLGAKASATGVQVAPQVQHVAMAWRNGAASLDADDGHHVGVLRLAWDEGRLDLAAAVPVPSRAHGLLALADGGFIALATRPGRWLLRADASGRVVSLQNISGENPARTLNGHALASRDGLWLFTTETDPRSGTGWISVRDVRSLARVAQFESHGLDPHQLLLHASDNSVLVANGGIARDAQGRKRRGEGVLSSLVRIDAQSGQLQGQWQLPDAALSLRHLAWGSAAKPLLGVALQAEHEVMEERARAPVLAVWDGQALRLPSTDSRCGGYAGDICAGPAGGFIISAQKKGLCVWWHPGAPAALTPVAELTEPCALAASADGRVVHIGAQRGAAQWQAQLQEQGAAHMARWPVPLAPDNHAVLLVPV